MVNENPHLPVDNFHTDPMSFGFTVMSTLPSADSNYMPDLGCVVADKPIFVCTVDLKESMADSIKAFSLSVDAVHRGHVRVAEGVYTPCPNVFLKMDGLRGLRIRDKFGILLGADDGDTTLIWAASRPNTLFLRHGVYIGSTPVHL